MDRKSRHNSLTVLKPHLFYSTYLSNYYFSEILLLFVEFTHSTTESWQLFFFEFFGGKDRPWRSWWRSMGAVLPYIVEESWLCYVELLPFQITGRNSFGSHQQPSEVLPCIIFYLFTRRKLRHRWLSNLSKFIQTTGSLHPYCSANHSYSYNRWPHSWLLIIWVSQSLVWLHIIFLKLFLTVFMGNSRLKVEKDSQYHQIHPHPKLIKVYSP